jgi:adenosylmethionine-8-amino-7-oxononanoate aminotransferase
MLFYDDALDKGFFHGHTYSANPLGCTAVLASIELLVSEEMQAHMKRIAKHHRAFQTKINAHPQGKGIAASGSDFCFGFGC